MMIIDESCLLMTVANGLLLLLLIHLNPDNLVDNQKCNR